LHLKLCQLKVQMPEGRVVACQEDDPRLDFNSRFMLRSAKLSLVLMSSKST